MFAPTRKAAAFALLALAGLLAGCSAGSESYYHGIDLFPQSSAFTDEACCHDGFGDHLGGGHR